MEQRKEKRTWLAVVLAILVTGLGHLYLRRWLRAAGWILLTFGASAFVPLAQLEAMEAWTEATLTFQSTANLAPPDPMALLPILAVVALSSVDAYLVARSQNAQYRAQQAVSGVDGETTAVVDCPNCGKEVDPKLDFCHWCTTELRASGDGDRGNGDENGGNTDAD